MKRDKKLMIAIVSAILKGLLFPPFYYVINIYTEDRTWCIWDTIGIFCLIVLFFIIDICVAKFWKKD